MVKIYSSPDDPLKQVQECLESMGEIDAQLAKGQLDLDMTDCGWINPCTALMLSNKIFQIVKNRRILFIKPPSDEGVKNYLDTIGFPFGKVTSKISTYSPITHFTSNANKAANVVYEMIDANFPDIIKGTGVKLLIAELTANIDEHSKFSAASIMAQIYPTKEYVDIAVLDNGITIPGSYESHKLHFGSDPEALDKALKGLSTKKEVERGRGLSTVSNVVKEAFKGDLWLISRRGALVTGHTYQRKLYKFEHLSLPGTMGYIRFKMPKKEVDPYPFIK